MENPIYISSSSSEEQPASSSEEHPLGPIAQEFVDGFNVALTLPVVDWIKNTTYRELQKMDGSEIIKKLMVWFFFQIFFQFPQKYFFLSSKLFFPVF